jgi:prepilin-type N-terminal cleavage/methylation domain-containing protein
VKISKTKEKSFTLIELLVVIAVIGMLGGIVLVVLKGTREKAKVAQAISFATQLKKAVDLYWSDMGFYPPDVSRGWDPGFTHKFAYNPDTGQEYIPPCSHCPPNWQEIVNTNWRGPYIGYWPQFTPWKGKYDYNYWPSGAERYGCTVAPGIYIGIQRDYEDKNPISEKAEKMILNQNLDGDGCLNGESQLPLYKL